MEVRQLASARPITVLSGSGQAGKLQCVLSVALLEFEIKWMVIKFLKIKKKN